MPQSVNTAPQQRPHFYRLKGDFAVLTEEENAVALRLRAALDQAAALIHADIEQETWSVLV